MLMYHCRVFRQRSQPPPGARPLVAIIGSATEDERALKPLQAMLASWALVPDRKGACIPSSCAFRLRCQRGLLMDQQFLCL